MTERALLKKALNLLEQLNDTYIFVAESCKNGKNGIPCKKCRKVLEIKKFLKETKNEK